MKTHRLTGLGLTEQQAQVYLKLLELGSSPVANLVKELDIARISCYDTLNRLISKGLVTFINSRGSRLYSATDPDNLLRIAKEKEESAKKERTVISELLPELSKIKELGSKNDSEAKIFKSKAGMKSLFELMLKTGSEIKVISATGKALEELKYYFPSWHRKRKSANLKTKILFNEELKKKAVSKIVFSENKFLPKGYSSPSTIFIFGNYVVNLLWSEMPFAFLIESSDVAKSYENHFVLLWGLASR